MKCLVILGAGNVATQLALALRQAGAEIRQVFSPHAAHARELADRVDAAWCDTPEALEPDAPLVLSALKDSGAPELWARMPLRGRLTFHTAGSLPLDALAPYAERRGVLYPLQSISKARPVDFSDVPLLIEANSAPDLAELRELGAMLSRCVVDADGRQRAALHLAAVFANNFTNHLYRVAEQIAADAGVPFELLLPLITETAAKVRDLSPQAAQTGPAIRWDENIIQRHLELLADRPELRELYRRISAAIHAGA